MTARTDLVLDGCRVEPLASYLKALGVLRLVSSQADSDVTARWDEGRLVLRTKLGADALVAFFVDGYQPSPVVSPWNGGSGFYTKDAQQGIAAIEESSSPRLGAYREAIKIGRELVGCADKAPTAAAKAELIARCRARLSDEAVAWLDAAVVLLDEASDRSSPAKGVPTGGSLAFPPLLGTGGNDGRLDFSNNFMQRLLLLLGLGKRPKGSSPAGWFEGALFRTPCVGVKAPVGQFDPGAAGGPNSAALGAADSAVNPADFVLMVEGALLIAAGAARRLGSSSKQAAMPFTFGASPVGYPSAAAEDGRGELWLPVWKSSASAPEIGRLFAEARCSWQGTQARSGLDVARAAVTLGVDRGIDRFIRYALVTRNGLATTAVPVGSIGTAEHPEVRCLADLDSWLDTIRRQKSPPHAVVSGLRAVEEAMFRAATTGGAVLLLDVLAAASRLDAIIATATAFHERVSPLDLRGEPWSETIKAAAAGEESGLEVRLAACFASLGDSMAHQVKGPSELSSLRLLLRPVRMDRGRLAWADRAVVPGLGLRPVLEVLAAAQTRRFVSVDLLPGGLTGSRRAVFEHGCWASLGDIGALLEGEVDLDRLSDLVGAFLLLRTVRSEALPTPPPPLDATDPFPSVFALLGPFFGGRSPDAAVGSSPPGSRSPSATVLAELVPELTWAAMLGRDTQESVDTVIGAALRRLRIARWLPIAAPSWPVEETSSARSAPRTASAVSAALLLRLRTNHRAGLLDRVAVKAPEAVDEPAPASDSLYPAPRS